MTITKNTQVDTLDGTNVVVLATGTLVLGSGGAGAAQQALPGFPAGALVFVSRVAPGGAIGHLGAAYTGGAVQVASDNAADTSTVAFILIG